MSEQAFHAAYNESRNGCNYFVRHSLVPFFEYSDGVKEVADAAGLYWLLDIIATEIPPVMRKHQVVHGAVLVKVTGSKAILSFNESEGSPVLWTRNIDYTDMPAGDFIFEIADEGSRVAMILITEH